MHGETQQEEPTRPRETSPLPLTLKPAATPTTLEPTRGTSASLELQNNNLQRQITELDRQTADLDIVSDGLGWAEAKAADAGIALFAEGSTIGDGLLNDTRDLMQADVDGVTMWRQTIGLGATVQAVVVSIEGTLGPLTFPSSRATTPTCPSTPTPRCSPTVSGITTFWPD